jgi:hypothetical protein
MFGQSIVDKSMYTVHAIKVQFRTISKEYMVS